jgi:hypothetical protein
MRPCIYRVNEWNMMVFKALPQAVSMKWEGDFTAFSDLLNIENWLVASVLTVTTFTEYKLALRVQRRFRWEFSKNKHDLTSCIIPLLLQ